MRDLLLGTTTLVSGGLSGPANGLSDKAAIAADGSAVSFVSFAGNLVADDTNGTYDVFAHDLGAETWLDLGHALAGSAGLPQLVGTGTLAAGSGGQLELTGANPSSTAALFFGLSPLDAPFKGGVLVPAPLLVAVLGTDAGGSLGLPFVFPAGVPSGTALYLQFWIEDAGATHGFAASNGLKGTTP